MLLFLYLCASNESLSLPATVAKVTEEEKNFTAKVAKAATEQNGDERG